MTATVSATSITVSGALQAGAVNVVSTATGGKEPSVVLFLVKPGVSLAEVYAFLENNKLAMTRMRPPNTAPLVFDAEPGKGKPTEVQTVLAPGQYVALNAEGEKASKWPRSSFAVAASPSPVALPAASNT